MEDHISKAEIRKDAVQGTVEAAATTVGQVATILTTAVRDVTSALGGLATEVFEIRAASRRAASQSAREAGAPDAVAHGAGAHGAGAHGAGAEG